MGIPIVFTGPRMLRGFWKVINNARAIVLAIVVHVIALGILVVNMEWVDIKPASSPKASPIQTEIVDRQLIEKELARVEQEKKRKEAEEKRKRQKIEKEKQRLAELEKKRKREEKRLKELEAKKQLEAKRKKEADVKRKKELALKKNCLPICSCEKLNTGSRKMIENAGFIQRNLILEVALN